MYKYDYSKLVWFILITLICLFSISTASLIYTLVAYTTLDLTKKLFYISLIIVVVFLLLMIIFFLIFKRYTVKDGKISLRLGFFKSVYDIEKITEISIYQENKLIVFFDNQTYTAIVIDKKFFDSFIKKVKEFNIGIICTKN